MFRVILLLLPALIPSWRFFREVAPSPRIDYRLDGGNWLRLCPRPARLSPGEMLARLFWNPQRNEELYLVTLSERLAEAPTRHSSDEINRRTARLVGAKAGAKLEFRLTFREREGKEVVTYELYRSDPLLVAEV
jgi:hypothetical protein